MIEGLTQGRKAERQEGPLHCAYSRLSTCLPFCLVLDCVLIGSQCLYYISLIG